MTIPLCHDCVTPYTCDRRGCIHKKPEPIVAEVTREIGRKQDSDKAAVGDTESKARGSGARFNAGKVPFEMIPVWIVASYVTGQTAETKDPNVREACRVLWQLGEWQRGNCTAGRVLHALPPVALREAAKVLKQACTRAEKPYPAWNWALGMPWSVPMTCAVRHLLEMTQGVLVDAESGLSHLGHVGANIIMLVQFESTYPEGDDRPKMLMADEKDPRQGELLSMPCEE